MSPVPTSVRVWLSRIHYVWVRAGIAALLLMPVVMWAVFRAQGLDEVVLRSARDLRVIETDDALTFEGASGRDPRALLLPGCPVDPRAYAPFARRLAEEGYPTSIVRVPYRCAPLPAHETELFDRVRRVMATNAGARWLLAGHSRGAAHALRMASRLQRELTGLVIIGSTHPRDIDCSRLALPVLKISGTDDGVAPLHISEENRRLLPSSTTWVVIDGGNHSQFAHYGFQLFDHRARISREEQQQQVVAAIAMFTRR